MEPELPSALGNSGRSARRRAPPRVLALLSNLILVSALAAILAGGAYWLAFRPDPPPIVIQIPTPTPPPPVVVDVRGAVAVPGVYTLPPGARIDDALSAAGGAASNADLTSLSRAAVVEDGEMIAVPTAIATAAPGIAASELPPAASDAQATRVSAPVGGLIDLNSASVQQLETLPGIGPTRAESIVQWRQTNGRFQTADELLDIPGIGQQTLDGIRPMIVVR